MNEENKISFGYLLKAYGICILSSLVPFLILKIKIGDCSGDGCMGYLIALVSCGLHILLSLSIFQLSIEKNYSNLKRLVLIVFAPSIIVLILFILILGIEFLDGFEFFIWFISPNAFFSILFLMHLNKKLNRTGLKRDSSVIPPSE